MESERKYEVLPFGDAALLVNFEQNINGAIHQAVINLECFIRDAHLEGVSCVQPAYCSLLVKFNPQKITYSSLQKIIQGYTSDLLIENKNKKVWDIPVCYELEFALDISDLSEQLNLSPEEIIELHSSSVYQVYMIGFLPGFPYLGKLPKKIKCKRKDVPRKIVPAQSVGLAGAQTGIYPIAAPGGWQIIGRTPIKIFDELNRNPFLFTSGDRLKFTPISKSQYFSIEAEVVTGAFNYKSIYG